MYGDPKGYKHNGKPEWYQYTDNLMTDRLTEIYIWSMNRKDLERVPAKEGWIGYLEGAESRLPGEGTSEGYGYHPPKDATYPRGPDDSRYPVGGLPARLEPRDDRYLGESHDGWLFLSGAHLDFAESVPVLRSGRTAAPDFPQMWAR